MTAAYDRKHLKYSELAAGCQGAGWRARVYPVEGGSGGERVGGRAQEGELLATEEEWMGINTPLRAVPESGGETALYTTTPPPTGRCIAIGGETSMNRDTSTRGGVTGRSHHLTCATIYPHTLCIVFWVFVNFN